MTTGARRKEVLAQVLPFIERARTFSGWSFDDLRVTRVDPSPYPDGRDTPWDYVALAQERAATAERVIDLGTGGGEVYSRIVAGLSARFIASEEWHVNAPVARDRLRPLGVDVVNASSERTPWADASFDVVLSRHEAIVPADIARILRAGGVFLTQQVARENWAELDAFFPERTVFPDHLVEYARDFEAAGLAVTTDHCTWRAAYPTLGEVAFMLLISPWEFPGFDPVRDIDRLIDLEDAHGTAQGIVLTQARYLLEARK